MSVRTQLFARSFAIAMVAASLGALAAPAPTAAQNAAPAAAAPPAAAQDAPALTGQQLAVLAEKLLPSMVVVEYTVQYDKADSPGSGYYGYRWGQGWDSAPTNWEQYIREERPAEFAGYVLSPTRVISSDPRLHPRFIKEVRVRAGGKTSVAKMSAFGQSQDAVFLDLAEPLAGVTPLVFDAAAPRPYHGAVFAPREDLWGVAIGGSGGHGGGSGGSIMALPDGRRINTSIGTGVFVTGAGVPVGMSFGGEAGVDGSWKGSPEAWPKMSAESLAAALDQLKSTASRVIPRVALTFRSPRMEGGGDRFGGFGRYFGGGYGMDGGERSMTEWNGSGVLIDSTTVLVLANFKPKGISRLETISVHIGDRKEPIKAKFAGTLREYGGFFAKLETPVEQPAKAPAAAITSFRNKLMLKAEVSVLGEIRTAYYGHDRVEQFHLGWKRELFPIGEASRMSGNAYSFRGDGGGGAANFFFSTDGELFAVPIERREKVAVEERGYGYFGGFNAFGGLMLVPLAYLKDALSGAGNAIDPENRPLTEAEENRLAWLGVETQAMTPDLARVSNVVDQTGGGRIGGIVTYIYPESPAAEAGIQEGDILLRLHVKGQPKPLEVVGYGGGGEFGGFDMFGEMMDQMPEEYFDQMPKPWGDVETPLARALTDIGFGTPFTADVWRDGKLITKDFTIKQGPAHYGSAARFKSEAAGISIRDLTYEVRRHYQLKPDEQGVIVSKIEKGSKAATAGLKPYEIIQSVNDQPVKTVADLEKALAPGGEFKLFVKRMTEGRVVKIKVVSAEQAEKDKKEKQNNPEMPKGLEGLFQPPGR